MPVKSSGSSPLVIPIIISVIAAMSTGCAATPRIDVPLVYLTDTAAVPLLPPGTWEPPMDEIQEIHSKYGDDVYQVNAYVSSGERGLLVIGMGGMGQELFELRYGADALSLTGPGGFGGIPPEYIVMDFQLCFADVPLLTSHLARYGIELRTETEGAATHRRIFENGRKVVDIVQDGTRLSYTNIVRGYQYGIRRSE